MLRYLVLPARRPLLKGPQDETDTRYREMLDLVRIAAKREPPLANLRDTSSAPGGAQFIATIAEITFYGKDQTGNDVSATGSMSVSFADFGDPQ